MFETHKIDIFFSGDKNLFDKDEEIFICNRTKVVRFFKLFLPCLTVMLLGIGVVLFSFETTQSNLSVAKEEKIYFEKFKIKNTLFEITEKDNRLSILRASVVEEKEVGTKTYDLENPYAKIIDSKDKEITLKAKNGSYNKNKEELFLEGDVVSVYDNKMQIDTNSATYNFKTETGFGNEKIIGKGKNESFSSNSFNFDKKNNILTLRGNVNINSNNLSLTTPNKATLFVNDNKLIATKALAKQDKNTLYGDNLTVFFKDTKNFEIQKAISEGNTEIHFGNKTAFADKGEYFADKKVAYLYNNVKIKDSNDYSATAKKGIYDLSKNDFILENEVQIKKETYNAFTNKAIFHQSIGELHFLGNIKIVNGENNAFTDKAIYYQNKDEFHFFGNVRIRQKETVATANKGIYYVKKNIVELVDNVVITRNGNIVRGDKAISDFNTSKSKLIAQKGRRISGKLIESKLKK
ncbi:MAG: LPS export ABC transporter periplasmic protein LptC [Alphaproteobacteria bacterium]|nr:LPS export ABC transporter periplasmic protein LptC [Alphaproteobacteria bacterium]